MHFITGVSSLGPVIMAHSRRGLCAVFLGHEPQELITILQNRFPKAVLVPGDDTSSHLLTSLITFIDNPYLDRQFVLDEQGTPFQLNVWAALRTIPIGTTVSYADIAKKIGSPTSIRAVAGACKANPLAIITPCHRVIKANGHLSGYRWGIALKKKQLDLEHTLKRTL